MNQKHTVTVSGLDIKFATGSLAKFANGAVTVKFGGERRGGVKRS